MDHPPPPMIIKRDLDQKTFESWKKLATAQGTLEKAFHKDMTLLRNAHQDRVSRFTRSANARLATIDLTKYPAHLLAGSSSSSAALLLKEYTSHRHWDTNMFVGNYLKLKSTTLDWKITGCQDHLFVCKTPCHRCQHSNGRINSITIHIVADHPPIFETSITGAKCKTYYSFAAAPLRADYTVYHSVEDIADAQCSLVLYAHA
jgi:hypothetical protein